MNKENTLINNLPVVRIFARFSVLSSWRRWGKHAAYDNETVKRLEDIETLDGSTKSVLFNIIDTFLRDAKARKAYAH